MDALGRTVTAIARNGPNPATDWLIICSTYDTQGNLLAVTDALGRVAFRYVYDLAKHPLRTESNDAGLQRTVVDALGKPIEGRDSKGALVLHAYDVLQRPVRLWARDGSSQPLTLRERLVYGDAPDSGVTPAQVAAGNLLGKAYQHYDEAGLVTVEFYDFKGNALEKMRQVISDAAILTAFNSPPANWQVSAFRVDWQPPTGSMLSAHASTLLDVTVYRTSLAYDALNRMKMMRYPQDVEGKRKELLPHYNRAGVLARVQLDDSTYVEHIAYNAKGQRTLIVYGNGVMTRYAYAPETFRLVRLRTEHYTTSTALTYHPTGAPLQDVAYQYDLMGNITVIQDRRPDSGVLNTRPGKDALNRVFTYDPLYRLLSATGRECDLPPDPPPWVDQPRGVDLMRARDYTEQYHYDPAGNLTRFQHLSGNNGFVRELALVAMSNRLAQVTMGQSNFAYTYDANGNLLQETASRHFEWDYADRMRVFRTQTGTAEPSVHVHYFYDAGGQRVKKLVRKQRGLVEVTVYVDSIFEYQRLVRGSVTQENNTLHVMDSQSRLAFVRIGAPFPADITPAVKFHLGDHLGSSNLVLDDSGTLVNHEEYTPYGETSFGNFAKKRYRFTGKERDEESGLSYHGARYYAPWLGRWISPDPAGMLDGSNLYSYAHGNPILLVDTNGRESVLVGQQKNPTRALNKNENAYMLQRAERLKTGMVRGGSLNANIRVHTAETGEQLLKALESASTRGPIKNLVTFGHSGPTGLFMHSNKGLYTSSMTFDRLGESRDLADLKTLIDQGKVRFSDDAVALSLSCNCGGEGNFASDSFAAEFTRLTGVTSIASVGATEPKKGDDSQQHSQNRWVKIVRTPDGKGGFTLATTPIGKDGNPSLSKDVNPLDYVRKDDAPPATAIAQKSQIAVPAPPPPAPPTPHRDTVPTSPAPSAPQRSWPRWLPIMLWMILMGSK